MKQHLRLFNELSDYEAAKSELLIPSVSYVKSEGTIHYLSLPSAIDLSLYNIYGESISQTTANCYVIREAGDYKFPLVYGNAIKDGATNSAAYTNIASGQEGMGDFVNHLDNPITDPYIYNNSGCTPASAELSLSDTDGVFSDIKLDNGYISFTVSSVPEEGGNGIISVLDESGVVLWSWHIWLWSDSLETVTITNNSGTTYDILPYNLGTKWDTGKTTMKNWLYQWGKHIPSICPNTYNGTTDHANYGTRTFVPNAPAAATIGEGLQSPEKFFLLNTETYNWFGSLYYNMWDAGCTGAGLSDNTTTKTVYDPSPTGFVVPGGNTFTGFTVDGTSSSTSIEFNVVGSFNNGWNFKANSSDTVGVFFPASGGRTPGDGSLMDTSLGGGYWLSSSSSLGLAYSLFFNESNVGPQNKDARSSGLSLRSAREV